ncbi:hypothetical protein B7R21_05290 [Subtercola boreus]|uniref:HTH tetR-type domain-containing protein n=1 Tax=Subtercola boreus TaxID=120213 RepID=A0A3E0W1H1_9MICO|nr:TetR/AcrR family transcriptional regulator [Subtercola boreus]RFA15428.1 hypothetical protein B7R21_05290 [Subtercola boreus]
MNTSSELGLRDRKRIETRARLERAAVTLALRDGLALATVDAISEEAGVSPRTFFNYFDSKEDAVLGVRDLQLTSQTIRLHTVRADGSELVSSVVRLLLAVIAPMIGEADLREQRMDIVKTHPELLSRQLNQMTRMADELVAAVRTLVASDPDPSRLQTNPEMLLALCGSGVRIAIREWVAAGSTTPPEQLESRAASLVREVTKNIQ